MSLETIKQHIDELGGLAPAKGNAVIPIPEAELEELERTLRGTLPASYRDFLRTFGASRFRETVEFTPVEPVPPTVSSDGRGFIGQIYGARAHDPYDLVSALQRYRSRMPERFLPIADDGGGDQIAMIIGGDKSGSIYYWDHNNEWDEEDYVEQGESVPPDLRWQNVTLIASSFDDLFTRLRTRPG